MLPWIEDKFGKPLNSVGWVFCEVITECAHY